MKAFLRLQSTPTGIDTHSVLTFHVSPSKKQFETKPLYEGFYKPILDRVHELPGVRAAGAIQLLPIATWGWNGGFLIEGRPPDPPGKGPHTEWRFITPGYFHAFKIPIVRGRDIDDRDNNDAQQVVIVNETLAKRYFGTAESIGQRIGESREWKTIVGVVKDVRQCGLDRPPQAETYMPLAQAPDLATTWTEMAVVVSADVDPASLTSAVRAAVNSVAPGQPIFGVRTMEQVVSQSLSNRRLYLVLIGVFASVAVALACAGVYGVLSYLVAQRTREFGVRMALGASAGDVVRSILKDSAILAGIGVAIGVAGALAVSRALQQMLFEVKPTDPAVYGAVAAMILVVVVAASLVPACRAMRVDPMVALRWE
jgi:predicted permease